MISSELIPIELRNANNKEVIWRNDMVNSPYGVCPLRLAFEKENEGLQCYQFATVSQGGQQLPTLTQKSNLNRTN